MCERAARRSRLRTRLRFPPPPSFELNHYPGESLRETLGRIEAWPIRKAPGAHDGSRTVTAHHLAITRECLYK